jgi:Leucine-rich repeat (LRR) protein
MNLHCITSICLLFISISFSAQAQEFSEVCSNEKVYYSLEEALKDKANVKKLDLSMQKIKVLPATIAQLENLECLDLSFNIFSTLPVEITQLKHLKYLNIMGTRYTAKVPAVVKDIPNLQILDIREHPEWPKTNFSDAIKMLPNVKVITQ